MSIAELTKTGLPLNRKERFFTATVLPMLICADSFKHFGRLTEMVGLGSLAVDASAEGANIQFFTEYGFVESLAGTGDAAKRFSYAPTKRDTPDVLIFLATEPRALIAIEGKMYDRTTAAELKGQLAAQAAIVDYLADSLRVEPQRVSHVALLPQNLATTFGDLKPFKVLTWEQVLNGYADVGPAYFVETLRLALARFDELAGKDSTYRANAEVLLSGTEIVKHHRNNTLRTPWMGRRGGLSGPALADDIKSGEWRERQYECSSTKVENPNWFAVADFVKKV